jgi:acyl-CoA synthetase (NDP forming)
VGIAVNFGNRSDVTESDFLRHLGEVEEVKAVALYLGGLTKSSTSTTPACLKSALYIS